MPPSAPGHNHNSHSKFRNNPYYRKPPIINKIKNNPSDANDNWLNSMKDFIDVNEIMNLKQNQDKNSIDIFNGTHLTSFIRDFDLVGDKNRSIIRKEVRELHLIILANPDKYIYDSHLNKKMKDTTDHPNTQRNSQIHHERLAVNHTSSSHHETQEEQTRIYIPGLTPVPHQEKHDQNFIYITLIAFFLMFGLTLWCCHYRALKKYQTSKKPNRKYLKNSKKKSKSSLCFPG